MEEIVEVCYLQKYVIPIKLLEEFRNIYGEHPYKKIMVSALIACVY